jgi:hypothetical protein
VDNHIIWLEPFLAYSLGPFSQLYEQLRVFNGWLFGLAGRTVHRILEWQHRNRVSSLHIHHPLATLLVMRSLGLLLHHAGSAHLQVADKVAAYIQHNGQLSSKVHNSP